jgi:hypothetical protein
MITEGKMKVINRTMKITPPTFKRLPAQGAKNRTGNGEGVIYHCPF